MLGKKGPGDRTQRNDVTKRSDKKQGAPPRLVDQPQADKSEDQIGHPNANGLQQGRFRPQASQLENTRRKIEDRIDAGQLVEKSDEKCQDNGHAQPPRPKPATAARGSGSGRDFVGLGFKFASAARPAQ